MVVLRRRSGVPWRVALLVLLASFSLEPKVERSQGHLTEQPPNISHTQGTSHATGGLAQAHVNLAVVDVVEGVPLLLLHSYVQVVQRQADVAQRVIYS
jgi:hypothetical protein